MQIYIDSSETHVGNTRAYVRIAHTWARECTQTYMCAYVLKFTYFQFEMRYVGSL